MQFSILRNKPVHAEIIRIQMSENTSNVLNFCLELGLDQDDEDLFNSLVAEIDEISAQVVGSKSLVNNKDDGKRSDIDELLIQQNFNGAEFTERHEFKNFHSETAHHHGQHQQQQHHQLCATSSFYEKGDGIRDANM